MATVPTLALAAKPAKLALGFPGWNTTSNWPGSGFGHHKGFFLEEGLDID